MKNLKLTTVFLAFGIVIMAGTINLKANNLNHDDINLKPQNTDLHFEIMDIMNENNPKIENSIVEVYDHQGKIIAFGDYNDRNLKNIINSSEFLTEIKGKKYYMLSFE